MRSFIGIATFVVLGFIPIAAQAVSMPVGRDAISVRPSQPDSLLAVVLPERAVIDAAREVAAVEQDPIITGLPGDLLAMDDATIGAAELFRSSLKAVTALFRW